MRNMVPARALARRSRNFLLGAIFLGVLGFLSLIVSSFMQTVPFVVPDNPTYEIYQTSITGLFWLGVALIIIAFVMAIRAITWKRDNPIAEQIGEVLEKELNLDDRYAYIRNLSKFAIGYVDAVLIGPPGVLVMRVTNRGGTYFNERDKWLKQKDKGDWTPLSWSPSAEVETDAQKIREYLQSRGMPDVPVYSVVVFTEDQPATRVTTENPIVPVMQPYEMAYSMQDSYFAQTARLDQLVVNKVIKTLFG